VAVNRVRVAIKNQANGRWLHSNGTWGDFQSQAAVLGNPGARSTSWSFSWVPPATGSYGVHALAWDNAGNDDPSAAWRAFTVSQYQASLG
jgi:hypothetical protein